MAKIKCEDQIIGEKNLGFRGQGIEKIICYWNHRIMTGVVLGREIVSKEPKSRHEQEWLAVLGDSNSKE